jgi:hypothetical protein
MKKSKFFRKVYCILIIFLIIGTMFKCNIVQADEINSDSSINLIVLFNNDIDVNVENLVNTSGGKILNKLSDIGGLEVECEPNLIPKIKSYNTVKSIAPNHIINMPEQKTINFNTYSKKEKSMGELSNNSKDDLYNAYQ